MGGGGVEQYGPDVLRSGPGVHHDPVQHGAEPDEGGALQAHPLPSRFKLTVRVLAAVVLLLNCMEDAGAG